ERGGTREVLAAFQPPDCERRLSLRTKPPVAAHTEEAPMSSPHPSPRSPIPPFVNRALLVVGVFTFASWTLIAALLLSWAPARAAAQRTVARVAAALPRSHGPASTCTETPTATPFEAEVTARAAEFGYAFGDDGDEDGGGFSWSLSGGEPDANSNSRATRLRFRENGEEYVVRDPALVAEAERATE